MFQRANHSFSFENEDELHGSLPDAAFPNAKFISNRKTGTEDYREFPEIPNGQWRRRVDDKFAGKTPCRSRATAAIRNRSLVYP